VLPLVVLGKIQTQLVLGSVIPVLKHLLLRLFQIKFLYPWVYGLEGKTPQLVSETFAINRALRDAVNPKGFKPFAPVFRLKRGF
tara:strand:+ start:647 stop:898 length:252 start_codon:yes stop_codon:yes gene_type:complete